MRKIRVFLICNMVLFLVGCGGNYRNPETVKVNENGVAVLSDAQVENIVKRTYQYVALYNVNNKFALSQGGWNTLKADTSLKDHTLKDIARPNNDTFYTGIMLDLRKDAYVVNLPKIDSKYVSLMVNAYDHYVYVPKSTREGDFQTAEKIIFYSQYTENYQGDSIAGINHIFQANGDFVSVIVRVMPHANHASKYRSIKEQISQITIQSLSEFQGNEPLPDDEIIFPGIGETDLDIFEHNFLEVMQFVWNHLSFDENNELDREVLACLAPLGVIPGKNSKTGKRLKIDGKKFREIAQKVQQENLNVLSNSEKAAKLGARVFKPKGQTDLEAVLAVSVVGPIGLPLEEAFYPSVTTADGSQMNAMNDYVIKMTKEELPPANAFWSLTLYDSANGFFIPNKFKKYSVGENAGMMLNDEGGIEIYVSAEKPHHVPVENWLPINRGDEDLDIILRIYVPELNKLKSWKAPTAQKL